MSRVKLSAEEKQKIGEYMKKSIRMGASERESFIAQTIGDVYDVELPVPEVIDAVSNVKRTDPMGHEYYLTPDTISKKVYTLTTDCKVLQEKVTPNTRTELQWTDLISKEYYVCLHDWLKGDHDVLSFYADAIEEAMNRKEVKAIIDLLDAGASSTSNEFTLDSTKESFDYPKLVEMVRSVAKYGRQLVLISGANVTTDILLMDFTANTFRQYGLDNLNIKHIPIEDLKVDTDGSGEVSVIDADVAYLVAVSDSKNNKPVLFARRKLEPVVSGADVTVNANKERAVIDTGTMINVGSDRKFSRGKAGFEEIGAVLINENVIAKFTRS